MIDCADAWRQHKARNIATSHQALLGSIELCKSVFMRLNPYHSTALYETSFPGKVARRPWQSPCMKLFFTGPQANAELLLVMLEKHGIPARQQWADPAAPDDGDLDRSTQIFVEESDYQRAYALFYTEREDEL